MEKNLTGLELTNEQLTNPNIQPKYIVHLHDFGGFMYDENDNEIPGSDEAFVVKRTEWYENDMAPDLNQWEGVDDTVFSSFSKGDIKQFLKERQEFVALN